MSIANPVIGLWAFNLSHPIRSVEGWTDLVAGGLKDAAANGADLLVIPEYACESWIYFAPPGLPENKEVGWMASQAPQALPLLQKAVDDTGVALVAGSMPWPVDEEKKPRNRAWTLLPKQPGVFHDKLVLTPSEDDPASWQLGTGSQIRPFIYKGVKYAVLICLDVEMPYLSYLLADQDIDVLLIPSLTSKLSGYHRVFSCARARAVELSCAVAVTGCVGGTVTDWRSSSYISSSAVYFPCEESLGFTGIMLEGKPERDVAGQGDIVYANAIPVDAIRKIRHGAAEVWPGKWPAGPIDIVS